MPEIRFITCGDAHIYGGINGNNGNRLKRVINLANQAYGQEKLDFIVFVGDIADMSDIDSDLKDAATIISGLSSGLTRYTVAGNHDVIDSPCITTCNTGTDKSCRFKTYMDVYPEQYYKFTKSGKIFNVIIPGVCVKGASWDTIPSWYFNFSNTNIDKTLPTLVFDHGPVYKFSNWDNFDMYAQNMSSELTKFGNLIGIYAGHVHQDSNNMVGNTRQVTNQATQSTDFVGYTRISDDNVTDYVTIRYQTGSSQAPFVDPFPTPVTKYRCTGAPNYQCVEDPNGPYQSIDECQTACKAPVTKYRCTGAPNYQCVEDPNGPYNSLAECQAACKVPVTKYRCTGAPNYQCVEDPNGPYNSLAECQTACKVPTKKYRCTGAPDFQCVEDPNGPYQSLDACLAACKPSEKKFKVNTIGSQGVLVMKSSRGDHTADDACKEACNIIKNIDKIN